MVPWCSLVDAKSNAGVKVVDPPRRHLSSWLVPFPELPLSRCVLRLSDTSRLPSALLQIPRQPASAVAIVDFNYIDTSGEVRDQRAEHEARLSVFMNTLKNDLAASGKFRVIVPACRPDPCSRSSRSELLKAAHATLIL